MSTESRLIVLNGIFILTFYSYICILFYINYFDLIKFKTLDKLLLKKFIPSFIITFLIAHFVLIMQVMWLYIDDIMGKGVSMFTIVELIFYMSIAYIPQALPLGVLVSSVMVVGNMGENYELTSIQSAGVSLSRVMRPLWGATIIIAFASFFISNNFMPIAQLKFKSRLWDIRKQRPTFDLESGVFNDAFNGLTIFIGDKDKDGLTLNDIIIYRESKHADARIDMIRAEKGKMLSAGDGRYLIMDLDDGETYKEEPSKRKNNNSSPFYISKFSNWRMVFDLQQFDPTKTDERLFKSHYSMLNVFQLSHFVDSLNVYEDTRVNAISNILIPKDKSIEKLEKKSSKTNSIGPQKSNRESFKGKRGVSSKSKLRNFNQIDSLMNVVDIPFVMRFPKIGREKIIYKAETLLKENRNRIARVSDTIGANREKSIKYLYSLHSKFANAVICIVFLFIGAPMGAIVRKGGFGYPILISILFFMLFLVLNTFYEKMAETYVLASPQAVWIPIFILSIIGFLVTLKAQKGIQVFNIFSINRALYKFFSKFSKNE